MTAPAPDWEQAIRDAADQAFEAHPGTPPGPALASGVRQLGRSLYPDGPAGTRSAASAA